VQIKDNYVKKSTGTLSFIMCFLYTMGNVARIFTTLVEVNDKLVLTNFLIAFCINFTLMTQILIYWKSTPEKIKEI